MSLLEKEYMIEAPCTYVRNTWGGRNKIKISCHATPTAFT